LRWPANRFCHSGATRNTSREYSASAAGTRPSSGTRHDPARCHRGSNFEPKPHIFVISRVQAPRPSPHRLKKKKRPPAHRVLDLVSAWTSQRCKRNTSQAVRQVGDQGFCNRGRTERRYAVLGFSLRVVEEIGFPAGGFQSRKPFHPGKKLQWRPALEGRCCSGIGETDQGV